MKKELFAAVTIISLLIGAAFNILHMKNLSEAVLSHLSTAELACKHSGFEAAEQEVSEALKLWLNADQYTHIFIRHSEIDSTTDAFYEALSDITGKNASSASAIAKIRYHIDSIYAMEKITLKSVF